MKKTLLFSLLLAFVLFTTGLFAQNKTTLVSSNDQQITLRFDVKDVEFVEVATDYGQAIIPMSGKAPLMLQQGNPELFYLTESFIIPDVGGSLLEISYGSYTDYENIDIAPSKGSLSRSIDPATVPFVKGEVYNVDAFFPGTLASLREPFIMRDIRGQSLDVYPVQYNPITKVLRVYSEITVTVNYTTTNGLNEFTTQKRHKTIDPTFSGMYNRLFINNPLLQQRGYPTGEEGELLIICYPAFADDMKPYIDWKRTIGRQTTLVTTVETGTTNSAIKNYITAFYNNPNNNLSYVLLIGDQAQIPHIGTTSVPSDIKYAQINSGNYLDILIGRMSSEQVSHVQTQVQRTIEYERDMTTADTWISKAVGLAYNEGGPGSGGHDGQEADYTHMNNIRTRLLGYGYEPVYQEYYGNCPGVPNTSVAQISLRFNDGASIANYCNHGSETAWYFSNFGALIYNTTHVNALQNVGKLPFIFSVACVNGKFTYSQPCFAEAWLRATYSGQPTGAIATFMATMNLNWNEPMTAQDEFVDLCLDITHTAGGYNYGNSNITIRTIAGAMLNATQKMLMRHGNSCLDNFHSWTVFGDPSLQFRTKTPTEMTVSHLPLVPLGTDALTVECDADGATAAVSYVDDNGEVVLLGAATVIDGVAEVTFEPIALPYTLTVAVTGFNKVTYISEPVVVGGELVLNPPINLSFTVANANHVSLSWDEPNGSSLPVIAYNIYRDGEFVTKEPVRSFTDIVPANDTYIYTTTALYSASGSLESEPSEPVTVTIDGMCVPIDKSITIEEVDETNLLVSWVAPEYDGLELIGYNVFRNEVKMNEEVITELRYLDTDIVSETLYCYQIEVVYNDCEGSVMSDKECLTLAISDHDGALFNIFPNPARGELNISGNFIPTAVQLFGMQGQLMYETNSCSANMKISVAYLPSGFYFIKLNTENGSVCKKLAIEN